MKLVLKKNLFIPLQYKIKNMSAVSILSGTGVAIITPFNTQQAVDYTALSTLSGIRSTKCMIRLFSFLVSMTFTISPSNIRKPVSPT